VSKDVAVEQPPVALDDEMEEEIISSKARNLPNVTKCVGFAGSVTRNFIWQNIFFGKYGIDFDKKKSKYRQS
jgi:hypothetical protein